MKVLNLYAGIGGNRNLWGEEHEVTAIEINSDIASEYKYRNPNDEVLLSLCSGLFFCLLSHLLICMFNGTFIVAYFLS